MFMNFDLTDEQQALRHGIAELCSDFTDEYWRGCDRDHRYPSEFYDALAAGGWIGLAIPKKYGGGGLGVTEAALVLEEIAASGAAMNGCGTIHLPIFGLQPLIKHGDQRMKKRYLPGVVDGSIQLCFALTERDAGTDTTRLATTARRMEDRFIVSGSKIWISNAKQADRMMLLARTTPREDCAKPTDGLTLFMAPLDPAAVEIRPIAKLGRNAIDSNEVFIDDLAVNVEDIVGEEGEGFRYLLDGLNAERILLAHEALGIGRVSLERAIQYAKERVVFHRPIGSNQGVQLPLAQAATQLESARLLARKAAWMYDVGYPCGTEANMAKVACADSAFFAADRAMQTHGGLGYAQEYDVERYFREARLMQLVPITQELALASIATRGLGLPRSF